MSNADWRSQLANFVDGTDSNLRTLRKDVVPQQATYPTMPVAGRAPPRQPEAVASARAELSTLLAAVQGSLADLRVEVAAAKRLSTNAAAVAGDMSPAVKGPGGRSASAHVRLRESRPPPEFTQSRVVAAVPPYALGQPYGPLIVSPPGPDLLIGSPHALVTATTPTASGLGSNGPHNEELVKAIDQRLLDLGHKIERSLERSMEEQSLRSQIHQAVQAAAAVQQQQMMVRNSVPSPTFSGLGPLAVVGPGASVIPDGAPGPAALNAAAANGAAGGAGGSTSSSAAPSSLAVLAMNKADAAEKLSTEVRSELLMMQKQAGKESEDTEKRLAGLQDASRQHWEKLCQVSSQADSLLAQRAGTAELQAEVARISTKLVQLDVSQDRTTASLEEQQRLMRQLTASMQKLTQDVESEHAISASRNGEVSAKLEAAAARAGELEARVARVSDVGARLARLGDVELKLGRMGELEGRVARIADLEARVGRLPDVEARVARLGDLEVKVARMGDMEAKMNRLGDVESKLSRLGDVEARLARLGDVEARLSRLSDVESRLSRLSDVEARLGRLGDVEARLSRLGDVEGKLSRLADMEARLARLGDVEGKFARMSELEGKLARLSDVESKLARLSELESRLARHGDMEAKMARMGDVEVKLARLHDVEARVAHIGELDARVGALQASVDAVSAAATTAATSRSVTTPVVASPQPEPGPDTKEALLRLSALEHQVARLAAAEQSSLVQERRRGQSQLPISPSQDSIRSTDGVPLGMPNLCVEPSGSPLSSARGAAGNSKRRVDDRPLTVKDLDDRIRVLEDMILQSSSYSSPGPNRSVQALTARMERLELIVRADSSIESMAQEARLAVTEEFVLELRRDFQDVVGPTLEKLAAHVAELRKGQGQGSPETSKMASELRQLSGRLDSLADEVVSLAQATAAAAPNTASNARAPRRLSESSDSVSAATQERLLVLEAQVKELGNAVEDSSSIFPRLQRHQGLLDKLQAEVEGLRSGIAAEVAELKARADGTDEAFGQVQAAADDARDQLAALARLDEQLEGVSAAVQGLSERLGEQGAKLEDLGRLQQEQQQAVAAASAAAAELASTAATAAAVASAGAGVVSRSLGAGVSGLQSEGSTPTGVAADFVDKAALEDVSNELRGKLSDLRNSIGDVRKELGSKVQTLDAQTRELLAFREEISTGFVELQDDVDRVSGLADDALRRAGEHETKLQELSQEVEKQAEKAATAATARSSSADGSTVAAQTIDPAALEEVKATLHGLQQRVTTSASEQQSRLEALDVKVHALSELITAASQDSQAGMEARSRAEELAYELAQAQEALDSLAVDSGRLAEQLAEVASAGGKTAEQLEHVTEDVQGHGSTLKKLQEGLQRLEDKVAALPVAPSAPRETEAAHGSHQGQRMSESGNSERPDGVLTSGALLAGPRLSGGLPASRSAVPSGSQAILNPLYSASSDDFFTSIAPPAGSHGPALQQIPSQPSICSQSTPLSPAATRLRSVDSLPPLHPTLSEEATVRDKALYYEKLASKKSGDSVGTVARRTLQSSNSGGVDGPDGQAPLSEPSSPRATSIDGIAALRQQSDEGLASPSAAAALAAGAVGVAGLRHAAQTSGGPGRNVPPVVVADAAAPAQELVVATGALAAVRAARSGLGLSGDLSSSLALSPSGGDAGHGGAVGSPAAAASQRVFGREQTFRRGGADEEVPVSSDDDEADEAKAEDAVAAGCQQLGREQTFRRGGADEEVSVSSGDDDVASQAAGDKDTGAQMLQRSLPDLRAAMAKPPQAGDSQLDDADAPAVVSGGDGVFDGEDGGRHGVSAGLDMDERSGDDHVGSGFDDDDDLELAGLAPPTQAPLAAAADAPEPADAGDDDEPAAAEGRSASPALDVGAPNAEPEPAVDTADQLADGGRGDDQPSGATDMAPAAEPEASTKDDGDDGGQDDDDDRPPSESLDIDEDIELEPGVNPSGFDYDDEDEGVWPASVAPSTQTSLPQAASGGPLSASKTPPPQMGTPSRDASDSATSQTAGPAAAQTSAPLAAAASTQLLAAPETPGASSLLSNSGALGGSPPLAPLQLSGGPAGMFSLSGDSLARRKLPPLGALPAGAGASALSLPSALSGSRGLDLPPPVHRLSLGPLQHSGNLSGNLSGLLSGELQVLAPPPARQTGGDPRPAGSPSAIGAASPAGTTPEQNPLLPAPAPPVARSIEDLPAALTASLGTSGELLGRRMLSPLPPLQRGPGAGSLAPLKPPAVVAPPAASTSPSQSPLAKPVSLDSGPAAPLPRNSGASAGTDAQESLTASGFSDMSIGDLHDLGPDRRRGEAVAESAADPVADELLAPAPIALPPHLQHQAGPGAPTDEPPSPLRSLLLAQPAPQVFPLEPSGGDDSLPRPAMPFTDVSTASGSLPRLENTIPGEGSALSVGPSSRGLSAELSAPNSNLELLRASQGGAGAAAIPLASGPLSKGMLDALLESASSSGGGGVSASASQQEDVAFPADTDTEPTAQRTTDEGGAFPPQLEPTEPPLQPAESQELAEAPRVTPTVDTAAVIATQPSASQPSTPTASPGAASPGAKRDRSQFRRKAASPGATAPPRLAPLSSVDGVAAAAVSTEDTGYDADFDDTATSSAARIASPAVAAAPSASSSQAPQSDAADMDSPADDNDFSMDLELPGMGGSGASGNGDGNDKGSSVAAQASALPPLQPGFSRNVATGESTTSVSPAPDTTTSKHNMFASEDSLALVAPEEGADGGILEGGSEEEDIFAESAEVEAMGGVSLDVGSELMAGGLRSSRSVFSAGDNSQRHAEQDVIQPEPSNNSLDFNGDVSIEAERIASMLTVRHSPSADAAPQRSFGGLSPRPSCLSIREAPSTEAMATAGLDRAVDEAPTTSAPIGAPAVTGDETLVQGSLDFYGEDDDGDTSTSGSSVVGPASAAGGAVGAQGPSGKSLSVASDSSMELEMFRPPAARQPQQEEQERQASRSGDGSYGGASSSGASQQKEQRPIVPALPFGHSLGDMSTSSGAYRLQIVTGDKTGAGCSAGAVRVTLYGSQGTHIAQLRPPTPEDGRAPNNGEFFGEGAVDDFMVDTSTDLGDLSALYIWHEGEGFSASWYVESVLVEQIMTGLEWIFQVNDWVRGGQRGGRVVRLPGAQLSISRENSLARLASSQPASPLGRRSPAARAPAGGAGRPPRLDSLAVGGASGTPQRRGMAALGDESMDVSSDLNSPVEAASGQGQGFGVGSSSRHGGFGAAALPPMPPSRPFSTLEAVYRPQASSRLGGERSAGTGTHSDSIHFSEEDDEEDLLPGMGGRSSGGRAGGDAAGSSGGSAFAGAAGAAAAAAAGSGGVGMTQPRVASNVPSGLGLVLEEDIEEVDGMLSTSAAFSLGPVSSRGGPALVSPRPPLPPGAPRRRDTFDDPLEGNSADVASGSRRQLPLPPTPPTNRRSNSGGGGPSRRQSFTGLEPEGSADSIGSGTGGGRRRVRISGGDDDGDLASELSVEGSELSCTSVASLSMYAPSGVRPPALAGGAFNVDFMGTSRKRVSWAEYAEEYEFARQGSSGSVDSLTEEDILAAQGETVRPDASRVGYDDLIRSANAVRGRTDPTSSPRRGGAGSTGAGAGPSHADAGDGSGFTEVPLKRRHGQHANSYGYKIKVFTADRMNAGLGGSTVHVELLGREATVAQELPKGKGSFQRGCVDRFTLYSHAGDMGQLLALKVWHEGKTLGMGNWGFEQVVIDDRLKGNRYVFRNPNPDCVLRKGRRHCLVMKPSVSRIDESEDLAEVAREYETQLAANRDLSESERDGLRGKLEKINQRLSKFGSRLAKSMSDSFGWS